MAGVLIYTAAPDSEGTLGGLVSLGEPDTLGRHLDQALEAVRLCASDPLCAEHHPRESLTLHAAACHACLFAPETSCERGNKYLDRSVLVGTMQRSDLAFFEEATSEAGRKKNAPAAAPAPADAAMQVIRDFLTKHPGVAKDRIQEEVASRLGRIEEHALDSILHDIAEEVRRPVKKNLFQNKEADLFGKHFVLLWYLKGTAASADEGEKGVAPEIAEVLSYCDQRCQGIVKACAENSLDLPVVGHELTDLQGRVSADAELAWPSQKAAVLLPERMEAAEAFKAAGWKVFSVADLADPQPLLVLLKE